METQTKTEKRDPIPNYKTGDDVVYGIHGRCQIVGIEKKKIAGEETLFYHLETVRSTFSRSKKRETTIWLPVQSAETQGLRLPMDRGAADTALTILSNREYYFSLDETWNIVQPKLEKAIKERGASGMAEVLSYLYTLRQKQMVPKAEVVRMMETVTRLLVREISDASGEAVNVIEEAIETGLKNKAPDQ